MIWERVIDEDENLLGCKCPKKKKKKDITWLSMNRETCGLWFLMDVDLAVKQVCDNSERQFGKVQKWIRHPFLGAPPL